MTAIPSFHNTEILALIGSSQAYYGMRVRSLEWEEVLSYNGTVFVGECSCREIGTRPTQDCRVPGYCQPIGASYGELIAGA